MFFPLSSLPLLYFVGRRRFLFCSSFACRLILGLTSIFQFLYIFFSSCAPCRLSRLDAVIFFKVTEPHTKLFFSLLRLLSFSSYFFFFYSFFFWGTSHVVVTSFFLLLPPPPSSPCRRHSFLYIDIFSHFLLNKLEFFFLCCWKGGVPHLLLLLLLILSSSSLLMLVFSFLFPFTSSPSLLFPSPFSISWEISPPNSNPFLVYLPIIYAYRSLYTRVCVEDTEVEWGLLGVFYFFSIIFFFCHGWCGRGAWT